MEWGEVILPVGETGKSSCGVGHLVRMHTLTLFLVVCCRIEYKRHTFKLSSLIELCFLDSELKGFLKFCHT